MIYDSYAMRKFMGIDSKQAMDSTTLFHVHHLLNENGIGKRFFKDITARLEVAIQYENIHNI